MTQTDLFAPRPAPPEPPEEPLEREGTLAERFERYHRENPQVYRALVRLARRARARGRDKLGIKMLWEVVRWEHFLRTSETDYRLNNSYTSRYARLIMEQEPDLAGVFDVRELHS